MGVIGVEGLTLAHADRVFIDGAWVAPSTDAVVEVRNAATEELFLTVAESREEDIARAVTAARAAFDSGPWPRLTHAERATYLRRIAEGIRERTAEFGEFMPRENGVLHNIALGSPANAARTVDFYADQADTHPFETAVRASDGGYGLLVSEPVGVVAAIIPWNGPLGRSAAKVAPALLAGCTVILKASPEAPAEPYIFAEIAAAAGLPPGVLNVVVADREASESLVRDPRVDKVTFTGSTAAGRRIASIMGDRIGRCTLELGGKNAAVVLDDADIEAAASRIAPNGYFLAGQLCAALTRVIVRKGARHDAMVEALASAFSAVRVGDPFDPATQMGPLAFEGQRDRVEGFIAKGIAEGATLATGGGRPAHLDRGWYVEPTVFGNVDNTSTIAQEEIFGPVLSVIPAEDDEHAIELANDTVYGLNASVFTEDVDRARRAAARLRSGSVGHNNFRADRFLPFGGMKQSGLGREGGVEGLMAFVETKTVILDGPPTGYDDI